MPYELGLQATLAVCLWIGVDLIGARGPLSRRLPILFLAASCATWALGELFIQHATGPEEVLRGRRILHLGVSAAPIAWLWTGAALARARWLRARPWLLVLAAVPLIACYSFLFWDRTGLFLDWTAVPPLHGPVFKALFRLRHANLRRLFGSPSGPIPFLECTIDATSDLLPNCGVQDSCQ